MVLVPTQEFNMLLKTETIFDPLYDKANLTPNVQINFKTHQDINKPVFQLCVEDETTYLENTDLKSTCDDCSELLNNNINEESAMSRRTSKESEYPKTNDGFLCLPPQRNRTFALGAKDLSKKKRVSVCTHNPTAESPIQDDPHGLSKSWSNLNDHGLSNSKPRKKFSLFSLRGSDTSLNSSDNDSLKQSDGITKSRTPSLLRKYGTPGRFSTKIPPSMSVSTTELNIPGTNLLPEHKPIKKSRSFSLRGSQNKLFAAVSNEAIDELETSTQKLSIQKGFIGLRSPFNRPKFDKEKIEMREKVYGEMLKSIMDGNCKRLKLLIKRRKTDVNTNEYGSSLIHEAAYKGCGKCVKALIKAGWLVDFPDEYGWRPLHAAVFSESLEAVKVLLRYHADPNTLTSEGLSPLHLAVYNDDLYITHELLTHGSNPLIESHFEVTPFQLAINIKTKLVLDYFVLQPCFLVDPSVQ